MSQANKQHSCHSKTEQPHTPSCHQSKQKFDWLLYSCLLMVIALYCMQLMTQTHATGFAWLAALAHSVFDLVNTMWWGVMAGILMLALLSKIPREFVMSILGSKGGLSGIARATAAGVLLDLCSHGILMVGAKLYERGASIGQVMAFLIASPWNSLSLTFILVALIGLPWTLAFIALSILIAIITGLLFDLLVKKNVLPSNPQQIQLAEDFHFWSAAKQGLANTQYNAKFFRSMLWQGLLDSRMVLRWILFGILLASLLRAFIPADHFSTYFGPTLLGLALTVVAATIVEVCSEGSTPIAADILTRANAPGNSFAFLMAGVSTDYTEVMVIKDTTKSWKIALFLPLLTLPQVIAVAWLINMNTI